MTRAVDLVLSYVEAAQCAREQQTAEAWDEVSAFWDPEVEIRVADRRGGELWRITASGSDSARERLSRPQVASGRLQTRTVRAFESDDGAVVVVEQISDITSDDGTTTSVPVCHIFDVAGGRIVRHSVYRNEA